ncbi:MAG: glycosyltransferase family 2 protein [Opitutaceae bacterium]
MKPTVSFIVLFYRDAPTIEAVIRPLSEILKKHCSDYEIIAIDDHSPDDTWAAIQRAAHKFPKIVPMRNETNLGVGASFRRAVEATQFEWIGYTDGDDQYETSDLARYFPLFGDHDVVTGDRSPRAEGWYRKCVSLHFNFLIQCAFRLSLRDTNSALKLYRGSMLRKLSTWDAAAFYDTEILVRLKYDFGARIVEIPINHRQRAQGAGAGVSAGNILSILQGITTPRLQLYAADRWGRNILNNYCATLAFGVRLLARIKAARTRTDSKAA